MSGKIDIADLKRRMQGAIDVLTKEFSGLRTGRASTAMLEDIMVDAYGSMMPLNQVASVNVPEARLLTVQVWDAGQAPVVDKAIRDSGLGLNPQTEGAVIRVPVPPLTEERRLEIAKVGGKYAEQARVSVRNVRRDGMETLKQMEKDGDISEDDHRRMSDEVQKLTDAQIHIIDEMLTKKEADLKQI